MDWKLSFITQEQFTEHVRTTLQKYGDKISCDVKCHDIPDDVVGFFHRRFFRYIENCYIPNGGEEDWWDVIYRNPDGIKIPDGSVVHTVYVKMRKRHCSMNSSEGRNTFIKMQNQLLKEDDCACFLVEAIAKNSQNVKWNTTVDNQKVGHKLIRRVSMDQFYALVTGEEDAFYKICMVLPGIIQEVVDTEGSGLVPEDIVFRELKSIPRNA